MFSPESLHTRLASLPAVPHYWVAYSGGVDSHESTESADQVDDFPQGFVTVMRLLENPGGPQRSNVAEKASSALLQTASRAPRKWNLVHS